MKGGVRSSLSLLRALGHPDPLGLPPAAGAYLSPYPQVCSFCPLPPLSSPAQFPQGAAEMLLSLMPSGLSCWVRTLSEPRASQSPTPASVTWIIAAHLAACPLRRQDGGWHIYERLGAPPGSELMFDNPMLGRQSRAG